VPRSASSEVDELLARAVPSVCSPSREEGLDPSEETLARFRTPAGLDLGAEGPEEIAAAICAEIVAVRRGRGAGFLKDRPGPIHECHAPAGPAS
jgi:hypothetical protein